MKKIIISAVLFGFALATFCQQTTQKHALTKTDYLQKSKKQKKTGLILVAGGAAVVIISEVIPKGDLTDEVSYPCLCRDVYENDNIKAALGLAGAVSALGSIPFFIAAGKNKKKANAASAFIDIQQIPKLQQTGIKNQSIPVMGLKISL